jgi:nitrite reductase/ring-hydroxylating ferredoxin subunit
LAATDQRYVDIGSVDDFPEAIFRVVLVEGKELGVLRWQEQWFAVRNICPHLGAPVCSGQLLPWFTGHLTADDVEFEGDESRPVLMCPWHRWEFDLATATRLNGPDKLKTYPVRLLDERVQVALSR